MPTLLGGQSCSNENKTSRSENKLSKREIVKLNVKKEFEFKEIVEEMANLLNISARFYDDGECEFEWWSDAGEDCIFYARGDTRGSFCKSVQAMYENFNPEDHAAMWYGANRGEPSSLRVLLDDAEGIDETLEELAMSITQALCEKMRQNK